jgi:copper transport protein
MARAIRAEIMLAVLIVILASSLRLVPPPRALAASAEPILLHLHEPRAMADLRITPGQGGQITLAMAFRTGDFVDLVPRAVSLTLAQPAAGIEPIRADAILGPDGLWQVGPLALPLAGDWELTLRLRITDFERVTLIDTLTLPE